MKKFLGEFKTIAFRGNMIDPAVGMIIGSGENAATINYGTFYFIPFLPYPVNTATASITSIHRE